MSADPSSPAQLADEKLASRLREGLAALSLKGQAAVLLHREGRSTAEIATQLRISTDKVEEYIAEMWKRQRL